MTRHAIIDAALKSIGGKIEDKPAFQKAMETVKFDSVRGSFRFNTNHFPIQSMYSTVIVKEADGSLGAQADRNGRNGSGGPLCRRVQR